MTARGCGLAGSERIAAPLGAFDLVTWRSLAVILIAFALSLPLWASLREGWMLLPSRDATRWTSSAYVAAMLLLSFAAMAAQENSPFLYFRF